MNLVDVHDQVADAIRDAIGEADPVLPFPPIWPQAGCVYLWAGTPWLEPADPGTYCEEHDVRLQADIVAGTIDMEASHRWLAERVDDLRRMPPIRLTGSDDDAVTFPILVGQPEGIEHDGSTWISVRVEFAPITITPTPTEETP